MQGGGVGSGHTGAYKNHSVTCVGYGISGTTVYAYLHDGWDSSEHYITFGNWNSSTATWVRP